MSITPESLLTLEAYARVRDGERPAVRAHRRLRSLRLGELLHLQFEDERTVRHQIQEMLRAERTFEPAGIQAEIDAYAPLLPDGSDWTATLFIEVPDPDLRRRELVRLAGVEDRLFVQVDGHEQVLAQADRDAAHRPVGKTSAVHFLRFVLTPAMRAAVKAGAGVVVGCDHVAYAAQAPIPAAMLASLAADLH
ncbi:MAG: DUF3501 family protein [Burkholderiales bacterium]|nr:MAG: DUF3501 family protein [Burkholderiales bacterium]